MHEVTEIQPGFPAALFKKNKDNEHNNKGKGKKDGSNSYISKHQDASLNTSILKNSSKE